METAGHRRSGFERLTTIPLHILQERYQRTSQVPPENVKEVENFMEEMQAVDSDEVEEEIERQE